jgi:hypothetical protein
MRIILIFILLLTAGYLGWDKYHPEWYLINRQPPVTSHDSSHPSILAPIESPQDMVQSDLTPEMGHIKTEVRMVLVG